MSTIVQDLNTLQNARNDMKTALENKGMTVTNDIRTYANAITNIPSGSGSGDVKLFDTVEHMQQDENPQEGDLAVVYREEVTAVTEDSEFSSCTFPNEVVLDEAFTDSIYGSFRAVDSSSSWFDGMVDMLSSNFRFDGYGDSGAIRVEYGSEDGITYTRTDGGEELQEFGVTVKWEDYGEGFNSVIGNFMKTGGNYFDGLYQYNNNVIEQDLVVLPAITDIVSIQDRCNIVQSYTYVYNVSDIEIILDKIYEDNYDGISNLVEGILIIYNNSLCYLAATNGSFALEINTSLELQNTILGSAFVSAPSTSVTLYTLDLANQTYSAQDISSLVSIVDAGGSYTSYARRVNLMPQSIPVIKRIGIYDDIIMPSLVAIRQGDNYLSVPVNSGNNADGYKYIHNTYVVASSQLDATADYVYEKTFYGKNGVEDGILTTNVSNSFADVNAKVYAEIQQQYDDMTPQVLENNDVLANYNFYFVPEKTDGTPLLDTSHMTNTDNLFTDCRNLTHIALLDTSNVTSMNNMFNGCYNLKAVPLLNTSNVTSMNGMFSYCQSLKSIPLFDMSNVTMTISMFYNCYGLYTIPQLNISSITNMNGMFSGCVALSNESLNNILAMCTNSAVTSNKTLKYIGLTEEQATICQELSNYSAFTSAGWTTGY